MTKSKIVIVDYQMGNLRSVQKALEHSGFSASISSNPAEVAAADKLILPGVGAFGDAIAELKTRSLVDPIREVVGAGKPMLGICLGLQMLFEIGTEGTEQPGMGIINGRVERFAAGTGLKVPHMGWNRIQVDKPGCPLLKDIDGDAHFYFVHSYYVAPTDTSDVWLTAEYGTNFCAAVWKDNLFATQFHPEKSQKDGLQMLKNFAEL